MQVRIQPQNGPGYTVPLDQLPYYMGLEASVMPLNKPFTLTLIKVEDHDTYEMRNTREERPCMRGEG